MFYINHGSDNFTTIDCNLNDDNEHNILNEIALLRAKKTIARFISTHPDEDHIRGIDRFEKKIGIENFYCVKNSATKTDESDNFKKYVELRDSTKAYHISKGCSRKWMNADDEDRKGSGVNILWPDLKNQHFIDALNQANKAGSPNNISPIVTYSMANGPTFMWMGDLEFDFMEEIESSLNLSPVTVLFAPHHGRSSGQVPDSILKKLKPKIIVIGEAASEHLHYYPNYNTITQNSAGHIIFECSSTEIDVFTSKNYEKRDYLIDKSKSLAKHTYIGTLDC